MATAAAAGGAAPGPVAAVVPCTETPVSPEYGLLLDEMSDCSVQAKADRQRRAALPGTALAVALVLGPSALVGGSPESPTQGAAGSHTPLVLVDGRLQAANPEAERVPDVSAYCNSCHGAGAEAAESPAAHPQGSAAGDHPVDLVYPVADPDYRPAGELDEGLLLLEGRVTCVTCHAHDDPEHAPVLATESSEICRACHLI